MISSIVGKSRSEVWHRIAWWWVDVYVLGHGSIETVGALWNHAVSQCRTTLHLPLHMKHLSGGPNMSKALVTLIKRLWGAKISRITVRVYRPVVETVLQSAEAVPASQEPELSCASRKATLHMGRSHKHLVGGDVHRYVGCVSGHERRNKSHPDEVKARDEQQPQQLQEGICSLAQAATCPSRGHGLTEIQHDSVVKHENSEEKGDDEAIEGSLITDANTIVNPRAVVI